MSGDDWVVEIVGLSRRFGRTPALDGVDLRIPRGCVFGLVGENAAGKTTLIKHIVGLFKAQSGSVRVFGLDPVLDPVGVLSRLGYLGEDRDLPEWMRIGELFRYLKAFYPTWDDRYAESLRNQFELDPTAKVKGLSQGQRARVGLIAALAYRPELLVLDEPSTGLDPVVRRDILAAIIRTIADEGRTVLFSSHLLDEVERVADLVAMIDRGKIVLDGPLDTLKANYHRVILRFDEPRASAPSLRGLLSCDGDGREWSAICEGDVGRIGAEAAGLGGRIIEEHGPSLDEIFVARVGARRSAMVEV
jgi:ABC-2 type transport system ATP-binding protein